MYTIKTPNKTIYTFILTFFHICVGTRNIFFKNKRQKSLECVKNIISLHQLSWKQSFYLKERLIPIEDLKRSPVKAVAFFLPYISEFCDNRASRTRNFVIFTVSVSAMLIYDFKGQQNPQSYYEEKEQNIELA